MRFIGTYLLILTWQSGLSILQSIPCASICLANFCLILSHAKFNLYYVTDPSFPQFFPLQFSHTELYILTYFFMANTDSASSGCMFSPEMLKAARQPSLTSLHYLSTQLLSRLSTHPRGTCFNMTYLTSIPDILLSTESTVTRPNPWLCCLLYVRYIHFPSIITLFALIWNCPLSA